MSSQREMYRDLSAVLQLSKLEPMGLLALQIDDQLQTTVRVSIPLETQASPVIEA